MLKRIGKAGLRAGVLVAFCATTLWAAVATDAPVAEAAAQGDLEAVRTLLRDGADVNASQGDGMTALHWAALRGDAEMLSVLVYAGANVASTTRLGAYTPLHLASRDGRADAVALLLEAGSDANALTTTGATPLHFAAAGGDVPTLTSLLEAGAEVDAREGANGQTPLIFSAAAGRLEAVQALIAHGADVSVASHVLDFVEKARTDSEARGRRREVLTAIRKAEAEARGETVEVGITRTDTPSGQEPTRREAADRADRDQSGTAPATQGAGATPGQEPVAAAPEETPAEEPAEAQGEDPPEAEEAPEEEAADEAEEAEETEKAEEAEEAEEVEEPAEPAPRPLSYSDIVGKQGGMTALHYAVREGHFETVRTLVAAGADVDGRTEGDLSTPLVVATVNGHYDLAAWLLEQGADPNLASEDGVAPLYATIANRWAPKALYPQPTAFRQQELDYMELMEMLLAAGADPNARVNTHIWYSAYNFDLLGVNFSGATPFWRAAKALDIPAMEMLVAAGADPHMPTRKAPERRRRRPADEEEEEDPSGLPPVEVGGPGIPPLVAAAGYGYGRSRTGNQHRHRPDEWMATARYLVEELGADVNGRDSDGFGALHYAAARGDNELIEYLVGKGADPLIVARSGQTTVDMANGPIQRVQPFFETIALLESMGAKNNNNCLSC
ncbi:MAG: ankyrin repeat domain-containing protein [Gemmatimonadota bacterium]|uniref:ankyrin repeat domain-containing protein n=1 Tax=Candidatus Palauibacter scopulicola TaxID=3056741 RepID=UPI00238654C5|nr:ankyrin repeat domain-containing protein [Candidatus Palauibacter scopulicola]MDE2664479.1 ankyrin repeat domain-containing protein [Candidatus Palauibacter scopulicola]